MTGAMRSFRKAIAPLLLLLPATQGCTGAEGDEASEASSTASALASGPRLKLATLTREAVNKLSEPEKSTAKNILGGGPRGDFDGDGKIDALTTSATGFTIDFANGKHFTMKVPDPEMLVQAVEPIALGPNNVVSFLVATVRHDGGEYNRKPQLLVYRHLGEYQTRVLSDINIMGRDVTCTKVNTDWDIGTCMFASYGKDGRTYSTLVEVDAQGNVIDVTRDKGLPWMGASGTSVSGDKYVNGKYMMGFAWVDLDGDGLPDLVGGGQHSQLVYALMERSGDSYAFGPPTWFDQADEYTAVSSLGKHYYDFPCVYVHVELQSDRSPRATTSLALPRARRRGRSRGFPWRRPRE